MAILTLTLTKETPYFCNEKTYLPFQCIPNLIVIHNGILILYVKEYAQTCNSIYLYCSFWKSAIFDGRLLW